MAGISITPGKFNPAGNAVVSGIIPITAGTSVVAGIPVAAGIPILAGSPIIGVNPVVSGIIPITGGTIVASDVPFASDIPAAPCIPIAAGIPYAAGIPITADTLAAGIPILAGSPLIGGNPVAAGTPITAASPNPEGTPAVAGIPITPARLNLAGNPVVSGIIPFAASTPFVSDIIPFAAGIPILAGSPIIGGNSDVSGTPAAGIPVAAGIPIIVGSLNAAGIPITPARLNPAGNPVASGTPAAGIPILAASPIIAGNPVLSGTPASGIPILAGSPIATGIPAASRIPFGERRAARVGWGPSMIAIGLSLLSAISLGSGAVSGRAGMTGVHPVAVIGIALVVGFVSATIVSAVLYPSALFGVPASALPWIAFFGLVQFAVGRTTAYIGLSTIGASRVALFISTQVPFAAFFAIAFTGESLTALVAGGTVAVMLGLLLASGDSLTQGWRTDRSYLIGCIAGLTAGAATGASTVLAKQAVEVYDSPLVVSSLGMLAAMFIVLPVVSAIAARSPAVRSFDRRSMAFVWLSGLCTTGSIVAQLFAVQRADVVIVAPILATFPLWTLLLSHIFISRLEQITLRLTIGTFVAVAGVIAVAVGGQL